MNLEPNTQLEWLHADHSESFLTLFKNVFGSEMSYEFLLWKYQGCEHFGIGFKRDDELTAFYGGIPRDVLYRGEPLKAVQMTDVMVHPNERGAFTRKGTFWKVASTYIGTKVGDRNPYPLAFGFPSYRHYLLGNRIGLYDSVDSITELSWSSTPSNGLSFWKIRELKDSDMKYVPGLWDTMKEKFADSVIGVRDSRWLQKRYLDHPENPYQILVLHKIWKIKPEGIIILRDRGDAGIEWIDMIADPGLIQILHKSVMQYISKKPIKRLFCWITASHAHLFESTAPAQGDPDVVIPFNILTDGMSPENVQNRWWLMSGDTDFR